MSGSNLPPVGHLPRWTRVGRLGKPRSPRWPVVPPAAGGVVPPPAGGVVPPAAEPRPHGDAEPRVASLQRNIRFLQQQHKDTLEKLHAEVESLRREKKELQYKLLMEPPSRTGTTRSPGGIRPPAQGSDARVGVHLEGALQDTQPSPDQVLSSQSLEPAGQDRDPGLKAGLIASLQPLRIHSSPSHPPRPPTLQECEVIIRQLYNANSRQSQEIVRVKALLREKIPPENYILTRTFLVDGRCKPSEEKKFPKLQTLPENSSGPSQSRLVLPALKQSLSSTIADRQRRSRAVQRERFKRVVH